MFEGIFGKVVLSQVMKQTHPVWIKENCINQKQKKVKCTVCQDICPERIYLSSSKESLDWSACRNCNLCVASCPSRALMSSSFNAENFLKLLNIPGKEAVISCSRFSGVSDYKATCFGSLSWEMLACLGLKKKVTLVHADCENCEYCSTYEMFRLNLKHLALFFDADYFKEHFSVRDKTDFAASSLFSRRQLFSIAKNQGKSAVSSVVPWNNKIDGLLYRKLLQQMVQEKDCPIDSFRWIVPMFKDSCRVCGICEQICPQKAIRFTENGLVKQLELDLFRCSGCQTCQLTCPYYGIRELGVVRLHKLNWRVAIRKYKHSLAMVLLMGGKSSRMKTNKALLDYEGKSFWKKTASLLGECGPLYLSVADSSQYAIENLPLIFDQVDSAGPLGGIVSALSSVKENGVLVAPCDMPLLSKELIQAMIESYDPQKDGLIVRCKERMYPIPGIYSKSILAEASSALHDHQYKLFRLIERKNFQILDWMDETSLVNVNTPEEYQKLRQKIK